MTEIAGNKAQFINFVAAKIIVNVREIKTISYSNHSDDSIAVNINLADGSYVQYAFNTEAEAKQFVKELEIVDLKIASINTCNAKRCAVLKPDIT